MYFGVETNVLLAAKSFCCIAKGGIEPPTPSVFRLFGAGAFSPFILNELLPFCEHLMGEPLLRPPNLLSD